MNLKTEVKRLETALFHLYKAETLLARSSEVQPETLATLRAAVGRLEDDLYLASMGLEAEEA